MINILFVTSFRISSNSGGVQRVTETLAKEFLIKGINVYYLSLSNGREELINGVKQYYLPFGKELNKKINKDYFRKLLVENKINVIINQIGFKSDVIQFIHDNKNSDTKIISVHHNCLKCLNEQYNNIYNSTLKSKGLLWLLDNKICWNFLKKIHQKRFGKEIKKTIRFSNKVVLLSESFIGDIDFYTKKYDKSKVISIANPNPFKDIVKNGTQKENRIIFVGRLSIVQKRIEKLIALWSEIYIQFPKWEFDIIGDGPDRQYVENLVENMGLKRINFYGYQDPHKYLKKAKIFVMVSDFEGFPMVLVEAQSYGVVPIGFESFSSIYDIIQDGKTGIIIKDFDMQSYVMNLTNLMSNEEMLNRMSINVVSHAMLFDSSDLADKWIKVFKKLEKE